MENANMLNLAFVTTNSAKCDSYRDLLDLPNINVKRIPPLKAAPDIQDIYQDAIAATKIEFARNNVSQFPLFVEQSGLFIDEWRNFPGGLSGVFFNTLSCKVICRMMSDFKHSERNATIESIILYAQDERTKIMRFTGRLEGSISIEPTGNSDFGWDAIFIPKGYPKTFAELGLETKQQILANIDPVASFRQHLQTQTELAQTRKKSRPKGSPTFNVESGGNITYVGRDANVSGGDFVGRDKTTDSGRPES